MQGYQTKTEDTISLDYNNSICYITSGIGWVSIEGDFQVHILQRIGCQLEKTTGTLLILQEGQSRSWLGLYPFCFFFFFMLFFFYESQALHRQLCSGIYYFLVTVLVVLHNICYFLVFLHPIVMLFLGGVKL